MGFLDKINYSMIVNSFKQLCKRGHREVFFTNVPAILAEVAKIIAQLF